MSYVLRHSAGIGFSLLLLGTLFAGQTSPVLASSHEEPLAKIDVILLNDAEPERPITIEDVQVTRSDGTVTPGQLGMDLFANDEIKTSSSAQVTLVFIRPLAEGEEERTDVLIQENSKARISSIFAYFGDFFLTGFGYFDTKTRYVRLGKRGTDFQISVSEDGNVELDVLRGEVEVERGEFNPEVAALIDAKFGHAAVTQKKTVGALRSLSITKDSSLPEPQKIQLEKVDKILVKTDKLIVASLAATPPPNIIPTSFEDRNDPVLNREEAKKAFSKARRDAILTPTAVNTEALGDAYKDLGAGRRATKEYDEAANKDRSLKTQVKFLANQAEAYRLAGNLEKAEAKGNEVRRYLRTADPKSAQLGWNALGNLAYDKAVVSVAKGEWEKANRSFGAAKSAFEAADRSQPVGKNSAVVRYNLDNVKLAFNPDSSLSTFTELNGTYRGPLSFPGAGIRGATVLVVTGKRFNFMHCDKSLSGTIVARRDTRDGAVYDFSFDGKSPIKMVTLKAIKTADKQIKLTNAATEKNSFSFVSSPKQPPLTCLRGIKLR